MCGHQHLAPVQQATASLQTLPSVSTPQLIPSTSRPDSPSIASIDSMIHSTDLESGNCCTPFRLSDDLESANKSKADLTPPYLQMSTNRQMHRAPICSPENCYFPVEPAVSNTNSSSGKASLYQANLKYLADQSNIQMQSNGDGQPVNGKP